MKLNSLSVIVLIFILSFVSCSKDNGPNPTTNEDDGPIATCSDGIQNGDELGVDCGGSCFDCISVDPSSLGGVISEEITLDPSIEYTLTSALIIKEGGVLIVPEGTKIMVEPDLGNYILVEQDGDIVISGSSQNPVTFESKNGTGSYWGGIIIAGNAPIANGTTDLINGTSIMYGGDEPADNSGTISYLILKDAASTSSNSELNNSSISLYGVGTATTLENITIFDSGADGLSIIGGTVNLENIYLENSKRNSIFLNDGWSGTLNRSMVLNTNDYNTIVTVDGENGNPNLSNFTAISEQAKSAFQFYGESGANITGLALIGFENSFEIFDSVTESNITVDGKMISTDLPYIAQSQVNQDDFNWSGQLTTISFVTITGDITTDTELDAGSTYFLSGALKVKEGATLTLPEGTEIIADVENGNFTSTYIVVEQGASIQILGTGANPVVMKSSNGRSGDWGGLILAGRAPTSAGINAIAEVENIQYGGSDPNDDSGNISHLILKNTGAKISEDSEYNGLTLYGVGAGTTISNVAVIDGSDDGIELFGGSVSATNLYLENNMDDSIDWTEGWTGSITNAMIVHTIDEFSKAIEADGTNENPTLNNITAISEKGGTAIEFKSESGATITGLSLLGYETSFDFSDDGPTSNVVVNQNEINTNLPYIASPTVSSQLFDWVPNKAKVNSMVLTGEVVNDLELNPEVTYYLDDVLSIASGSTLTIPSGTRIIADVEVGDETQTYIVVQKNGNIEINGTANNPVVMTSSNKASGDWGGLIVAGNGVTSLGTDVEAEVGGILYGGNDNADSSGTIEYLIIEYAGAQISLESEYNGLSLYAVGSGTTIQNIAILNGNDDGIEFFGGAVSVENIYLENNSDDSIDWIEEWDGSITNAYIKLSNSFSSAIEAEGNSSRPTLNNVTATTEAGGNALTFKRQSGATIDGLSLDGFASTILMVDGAPLSNVLINGADADPNDEYELTPSVDISLFDWVFN